MLGVVLGTALRIGANSYLNVFQKLLTNTGSKSSVINFYTYLGLSFCALLLIPLYSFSCVSELALNFVIMGFLGALGNYFIIKALSLGELSALAPINSYKPVVAMIIAFLYLGEIPSLESVFGIFMIILGTYILSFKGTFSDKKAVLYRVLALIFSGSEAVFIKKIILLTNLPTSFALWAFSGLIFSLFFMLISKNKPKLPKINHLLALILFVALMQYSTNYVFSKINVSYALALFQLSTVLSVFLGVKIFKEQGLIRKIIASTIMVIGAVIILIT